MSNKPSLVVILSRFPYPLEKGDKLRAYHQLKDLSLHFSITLICCVEEQPERAALDRVEPLCQSIHLLKLTKVGLFLELLRSVFSQKPFQVQYFYRWKHAQSVRKLLNEIQPDHIYCQLVRVAEYVKHYHYCPKTIDYMDTLSKGMERRIVKEPWYKKWFYRNESKRLARYERSVFDYFEFKTIISKQDRNYLLHPKKDQVHIVPNGVDESFFESLELKKDKDIVFTGNFSYPPNIEAAVFLAEDLLPALHQRGFKMNLLLSGASPTPRVKELANEFVEVSGWVNDIRSSYQRSKIFVAPMFIGTGLQNKLLEAMASGLPCATTPLANNALGGTSRENILLAENSHDFVEICVEFFQNSSSFNSLASNGRRYVELNYTWNKQNKLLIHLLQASRVS